MTTTASSIAQAFIDNLTATSALGACSVKIDYTVLETVATCAMVVSWQSLLRVPTAFGTNKDHTWSFLLQGYIKDTGDANAILRAKHNFIDTVITSLNSDDTLQGTVANIQEIRAATEPGETFAPPSIGQAWVPLVLEVDLLEFP